MRQIFNRVILTVLLLTCLSGCGTVEISDESIGSTSKIQDMAEARIGVITGSLQSIMLPQMLPDAVFTEYNSNTDAAMALAAGKIDAFSVDESVYLAMKREGQNIQRIDEAIAVSEFGMLFGKGSDLKMQDNFNTFLADSKENGLLDQLEEKWFVMDEPTEIPDYDSLTGEEGTLLFAIESVQKPFSYMKNGSYTGFDVELMTLFAREYGYRLKIEDVSFGGILSGIEQGRYDIAGSGVTITEERKESMDFSDCYHVEDLVLVVKGSTSSADGVGNIFSSFKESFEKTFIRENRWKLIVEGTVITLLISFFATLGGTALGFALYMVSRTNNDAISKITKKIAKIYSRLIAGTPALVILMILFYVILGKFDISGIMVAIIGFILIFGSFVYDHMTLTVESVDWGQTEAAYALGYSRNKTFFRIILPQAMKAFLPTYTGEVIGLIKGTAVVGYIAVTDLTKMGDIIRSNTYEALFPLLTVAVIYFVITWGVAELLGIIQKKVDSRKRKDCNILKGVAR